MRLERTFDLGGVVLAWTMSFLADRTQQVAYNGQLSSKRSVQYGVPQGSVLGPLLFVLYTAELHNIVAAHDLRLHQYADDCQIYATALGGRRSGSSECSGCVCRRRQYMAKKQQTVS